MSIRPIPTWYRGHYFRSRLEARWAVFFDALDIQWQYEPQGYHVSYRLSLGEGAFPYLPDFWLPNQQMWVEVKGSLTSSEVLHLLNAAACLSCNDNGGCHDAGGYDTIVLGEIPDELDNPTLRELNICLTAWSPVRLHMHKGDLEFSAERNLLTADGSNCPGGNTETRVSDSGDVVFEGKYQGSLYDGVGLDIRNLLLFGYPIGTTYSRALRHARSARFEHGQSGGML